MQFLVMGVSAQLELVTWSLTDVLASGVMTVMSTTGM